MERFEPSAPRPTAHERRSARARLQALLAHADIVIDGDRPWDPRVKDERFFDVAFAGSLAIGEAYMDGLWECDQLDELVCRFRHASLDQRFQIGADGWRALKARMRSRRSPPSADPIGRVHDGMLEVFEATLDPRMVYSCAYWKTATTLAAAQEARLDLACRKLGLLPGMRVLDIGCGWGSFAHYAAERYGVEVVGVAGSREQMEYGQRRCKGLPVEIRLQDYREVTGSFDRVFSAGVLTQVDPRNHRRYFEVVHRALHSDGLFLLDTAGGNRSRSSVDAWTDKYIVPNAVMPSAGQIGCAVEKLFVIEDWHTLGPDHDKTLVAWFQNFDRSWPRLRERYDERFYRMWKFFLLASAGNYRARVNHLWQFVFSKKGLVGGYATVR
jgi:cyclopropane-fatty-acyl-phospholipid synthase